MNNAESGNFPNRNFAKKWNQCSTWRWFQFSGYIIGFRPVFSCISTTKKFTKKRDTRAKLLFCFINLLFWGALGPMAFVHLSYEQTDATLVDVTCCVLLHTLLHVVGICCAKFETSQTFSCVQRDATIFFVASVCMGLCVGFEGALATTTTTTAMKTSPKNWIGVLSNHVASILTRSICQM